MRTRKVLGIIAIAALSSFTTIYANPAEATLSAENVEVIHISNAQTWKVDQMSGYVGKTVRFDCPMVVCNNRYGYEVSPRRIYSPTNQELPGSDSYRNLLSLNQKGTMRLSGISGPQIHRMGEKIIDLTVEVLGATNLRWVSGTWSGNTRDEMEQIAEDRFPELGDYRLLVCGMNLEYYLVDQFRVGSSGSSMGPRDWNEHQKQRTKTSEALAAIRADIFGFVEIQQGDGALAELADDLEAATGEPYRYIRSGTSINGTYTQSCYIYNSATVEPYKNLYNVGDGNSFSVRQRMQAFKEKETGEVFIFSLNHLKAKGSGGTGMNADKGDGQGSFNYSRVQEARSIQSGFSQYYPVVRDRDVLLMGDLNAYAMEDPITELIQEGYTDLHRWYHADSSYSYIYNGAAGYLDHALANRTLLPQVTGAMGYHINSDENDDYTYDSSNDLSRFRCSDHDPVLVGLKLDGTNSAVTAEQYMTQYYRLYDLQGRLVIEGSVANGASLKMPDAPGLYVLVRYSTSEKNENDKQIITRKIRIE